jgi:hypothetical protein
VALQGLPGRGGDRFRNRDPPRNMFA